MDSPLQLLLVTETSGEDKTDVIYINEVIKHFFWYIWSKCSMDYSWRQNPLQRQENRKQNKKPQKYVWII